MFKNIWQNHSIKSKDIYFIDLYKVLIRFLPLLSNILVEFHNKSFGGIELNIYL